MNQALFSGLFVLVSFSLYMLGHLIIFRIFQPKERWVYLKWSFLIFLPLAMVSALLINNQLALDPDYFQTNTWAHYAGAFILLGLLHNAYLMFYAFIDRSISIRINCEVFEARPGKLSFEELRKRYDPDNSYRRRLEILRDSGFFEQQGEIFHLTPKGDGLASKVKFLKDLYKLGPGG